MARGFNNQIKKKWHTHLIALLKVMGYPYDNAGVCFGIAATMSSAHLAGKMKIFEESLNALSHADPKTISTPNHGLTNEEYWDVLALLDSIALHQDTKKSKHLFSPAAQFSDQAAGVIEAGKILNLKKTGDNDIAQVHTSCKAVEYNELKTSITKLFTACKKLQESKAPVSFLISMPGHTISCNYDPISDKWLCIDSNKRTQDSSPIFVANSAEELIDFVWTSLNQTFDDKAMCLIDTQTLCRKNDLEGVKSALSDWKINEGQYLSAEYLKSLGPQALSKMVFLAIRIGDLETINAILNADLNKDIFHSDGGAIYYAIQFGRNEILSCLLQHGVDINKPTTHPQSIWQVAIDNNQPEAIKILLENHYPDFTQVIHDPLLLSFICEHGRLDIAEKLLLHPIIKINDQDQNGDTALHCAVRSG
jgi:hypothetical protein